MKTDRLMASALLIAGASLGAALFILAPHGAKPSVQDEFVYLFQAKMLASGHLAYPPPPLPEFFEAAHVLVVPHYAAKYFPGHAAVLAPFVALGVPWLAPSLLFGATLAALYLAGRFAQLPRWSALLACALFIGSKEVCSTFGTYLSQTTSVALVACATATAAALRARPTTARVALLFAFSGAAVLVRPFAGVALVGASVAGLALLRPQPWQRCVVPAIVPLGLAAALALLACRATTSSWTQPPWLLYARQYMPFDGPGIGPVEKATAVRRLPDHLAPLAETFRASRAAYTFARLPGEARRRAEIVEDLVPGLLVIPFVLVGVGWLPLIFAPIFAALYFGLQLTFHVAMPLYYLETCPWLVLSAAAGAVRLAEWIGRFAPRRFAVVLAAPLFLAGLAVGAEGSRNLSWELERARLADAPLARYEAIFSALRGEHAIVFLRYPRGWPANIDLGYNEPDLRHADLIRARDLGSRNVELLAAFPGRPGYVLDLQSLALSPVH